MRNHNILTLPKKFCMLILTLTTFLSAAGQTLPTEKIFFMSDRQSYTTSDTLRVSGVLVRTDHPSADGKEWIQSSYSRYLYLDLFDSADSLFRRQKVAVADNGTFTTMITVAPDTPRGIYYLRAYTKLMCNFSSYTVPVFPIEISPTPFLVKPSRQDDITCSFYPEGGRLVGGEIQNVAVCLKDGDERPLQTEVFVTNEHGDTLTSSHTTPSGWQVLSFNCSSGEHYYLRLNSESGSRMFAFPETEDGQPALRLSVGRGRLAYQVNGTLPNNAKLYAYNQSTGLLLLPLQKTGVVSLNGMSDGLVSLLLTDRDDHVLSEGHYWYGTQSSGRADLPETMTCGSDLPLDAEASEVVFVRFLPVEDDAHHFLSNYVPTAEAMVNYLCDLKSDELFPVNYSREVSGDRHTDIQAWLLSAHFARLDVAKAMKDGWKARFQPETVNLINGQVSARNKRGQTRKLHEGTVFGYQRSNAAAFSADIRKDGTFALELSDFPEGEEFYIEAAEDGGRAEVREIEFFGDTVPSVKNSLWLTYPDDAVMAAENTGKKKDGFSFDGINEVSEVLVRAKVKTDHELENKEFYGNKYISEEVLDEKNFLSFQQMVYHFSAYMKLVMAPQQDADESSYHVSSFKKEPPQWHLFPAAKTSTLSGKDEIRIYVDNVLLTATEAYDLDMGSIASVEFLGPAQALGRHSGCINGCLELFTKKYKKEDVRSKGVFYSPLYGIANYEQFYKYQDLKAPTRPGCYQMLVDRISSKGIESYGRQVMVAE